MLGRQQIFLELNEELEDYDDLIEIMSNTHLNNHFLSLAREVRMSLFIMIGSNKRKQIYWKLVGYYGAQDTRGHLQIPLGQ